MRVSNELVDELLAADVLVFGVPMYNFKVPAQLKAWIDQIVRFGRTFIAEPQADGTNIYKGLATGKRVFIVTSRGGGGRVKPSRPVSEDDIRLYRHHGR